MNKKILFYLGIAALPFGLIALSLWWAKKKKETLKEMLWGRFDDKR